MDLGIVLKVAIATVIIMSCSKEGEGFPHNLKNGDLQYDLGVSQTVETMLYHETYINGNLEVSHRVTRKVHNHGEVLDSLETDNFVQGPYNPNELGDNHGVTMDATHESLEEDVNRGGLERGEYDHRELGPGHGEVMDTEEFEDNSSEGKEEDRQLIGNKGRSTSLGRFPSGDGL